MRKEWSKNIIRRLSRVIMCILDTVWCSSSRRTQMYVIRVILLLWLYWHEPRRDYYYYYSATILVAHFRRLSMRGRCIHSATNIVRSMCGMKRCGMLVVAARYTIVLLCDDSRRTFWAACDLYLQRDEFDLRLIIAKEIQTDSNDWKYISISVILLILFTSYYFDYYYFSSLFYLQFGFQSRLLFLRNVSVQRYYR